MTDRFQTQAAQYAFPYHWIPFAARGAWHAGRVLAWSYQYLALLETVREATVSLQPRRVLDFGCGDGRLARELLEAGVPEVVGVDLVSRAVAFAQAFNSEYGSRARFLCERLQNTAERAFDAAVAMEVFEHIPESELPGIVRALWERTRAGGKLIVSVPTANRPVSAKHERHYTAELLEAHLSPWFEMESTRYVHRLCRLGRILERVFSNPVGVVLNPAAVRFLTGFYRRHLWRAAPDTGAHLVAVARRSEVAG